MLTRKEVQELRNELDKALAVVTANTGFKIDIGRITFTDSEARMKLTAVAPGAKSSQDDAFGRYVKMYDLDTSKVSAEGYQLVGYKPKARKNCWIVRKNSNGKNYVVGTDFATAWFKKDAA
tara:strand:- start:10210 stop:10572 length:363 start_codon:yes stop_codon:yes gene_type:complete